MSYYILFFQEYFVLVEMIIVSQCAPKIGPAQYDPLVMESNDWLAVDEEKLNEDKLLKVKIPNNIDRRNENDQPTEETVVKKPCQGYDYDESKCKVVNNRVLCGYNKNTGEIKKHDEVVDLGNGCRMRNDRIECGYVEKPLNQTLRAKKELLPEKLKLKVTASDKNSVTDINLKEFNNLTTTSASTVDSNVSNTKSETESSSTIKKHIESSTLTTQITIADSNLSLSTLKVASSDLPTPTHNSNATNRISNRRLGRTEVPIQKSVTICIDRQDRIVCYETTKFKVFKKVLRKQEPTNTIRRIFSTLKLKR
jgi:hypothetical protein